MRAQERVAHDPGLADSGVTILLTTQYLDEADQLAARIAVIDHGRKIAEGTSRELKAATGSGFLHVALADPARLDEAAECSSAISAEACSEAPKARRSRSWPARRSGKRGDRRADRRRIDLADFAMGSPSLEEVFFALTGRAAETKDDADERRRLPSIAAV